MSLFVWVCWYRKASGGKGHALSSQPVSECVWVCVCYAATLFLCSKRLSLKEHTQSQHSVVLCVAAKYRRKSVLVGLGVGDKWAGVERESQRKKKNSVREIRRQWRRIHKCWERCLESLLTSCSCFSNVMLILYYSSTKWRSHFLFTLTLNCWQLKVLCCIYKTSLRLLHANVANSISQRSLYIRVYEL